MYKIPANTLFIGQTLVFVPECQSTNTLLAELATKSVLPEGAVVITANQTAGRGQRGNTWHVQAGQNLTLSILLKPNFLMAKDQFQLTIISSLAVCEYLHEKGLSETKIKWPNDILVNQKKICGMLIENTLQGESIQQSIVGIGININQREFSLATATSLFLETKNTVDLNQEMYLLLQKIESVYLQFKSGGIEKIKEKYLDNLFGKDQLLPFESKGKKFNAKIETVDEFGQLVILVNHERLRFSMKEIAFQI